MAINLIRFGSIDDIVGWGEGGEAEGVRLIVDSTTISNLFYNLHFAPKSTIYKIQAQFGYNLQFFSKPIMQSKNLQDFSQKKMRATRIFQTNL